MASVKRVATVFETLVVTASRLATWLISAAKAALAGQSLAWLSTVTTRLAVGPPLAADAVDVTVNTPMPAAKNRTGNEPEDISNQSREAGLDMEPIPDSDSKHSYCRTGTGSPGAQGAFCSAQLPRQLAFRADVTSKISGCRPSNGSPRDKLVLIK
jgi:hypothetical protein